VSVSAIIASENFKSQDYYGMLCQVMPELESSTSPALHSGEVPSLRHVIMVSEKERSGTIRFTDVMAHAGSSSLSAVADLSDRIRMDDAANIQFTSGTTGNPKGVTLSHHNLVNNAHFIGHRIGYDKQVHRICCSVPFYHCFGNVAGTLASLVHGAALVVPCPR